MDNLYLNRTLTDFKNQQYAYSEKISNLSEEIAQKMAEILKTQITNQSTQSKYNNTELIKVITEKY